MSDAPRIALKELRGFISDAGELAKGTQIADAGVLTNLARHENRLYCEAKGSGPSAYRVSLTFGAQAGELKARCSCMAARSRPFCKHSAALLVCWARSPESFVVSEAPPASETPATRKRVKTGKASGSDLMKHGVERVETLVRELAVAGIAAIGSDRVEQVRALGEALRENRLRRLSARTLELARIIEAATDRRGQVDAMAYADLVSDMLLTARKLGKYLAGEPLEDRYVEELVGKTWRKTDRESIAGLDLVEYAFLARVTADDYVIRESRFIDLCTGVHYTEKQILPSFLDRRTDAKRTHAGTVLANVSAGMYPGFAPRRLDLEVLPEPTPVGAQHVAAIVEQAHGTVAAALAAFQEHRRDVFAPDAFPVAVRTDLIVAEAGRLRAVDAAGEALHLPNDAQLEDAMALALRRGRLAAIVGEMTVDGIVATLVPMAMAVDTANGLALAAVAGVASRAPETGPVRSVEAATHPHWLEHARQAGVSPVAVALGEARLEMADALLTGLGSLVPRVTDPLVARLSELGLAKPAALLAELPTKPDPADRLDGFIKVHQIVGLALVRVAGATGVAPENLERVPTAVSIAIMRPQRVLTPEELLPLRIQNKVSRFEAEWHRAKHFESIAVDDLLEEWPTTWSDGEAARFIARSLCSSGERAIHVAKEVLASRVAGITAQLTAIQVLAAISTDNALELLTKTADSRNAFPAACARARAALPLQLGGWRVVLSLGRTATEPTSIDDIVRRLTTATDQETRFYALEELEHTGEEDAIPIMRQVWRSDQSRDLRVRAAVALGALGDSESVEALLALVRDRRSAGKEAKAALVTRGQLADIRAVPEILRALIENWAGPLPAEALGETGLVAVEPIIALVTSQPELAQRKSLQNLIAGIGDWPQTTSMFVKRVSRLLEPAIAAEPVVALLRLASESEPLRQTLAQLILERVSVPSDKAEKALVRAAQQMLQKGSRAPGVPA